MRINEGDIFLIPVTPERVAVGQVAWKRRPSQTDYLFVVFDGFYPSHADFDLDVAISRPVRLQAISFDPLIRNGRWPIVGHRPISADVISWPTFKVMTSPPDEYAVGDHSGAVLRKANRAERDRLPTHTSSGPILLEHALHALAGLGSWSRYYDVLLPPGEEPRPIG